jgi:uncharacterized protein
MLQKIDITPSHREVFGNPAPLGLLGLAIACFALLPMTLGSPVTQATFLTAAVYALLFGAGCQFIAGLMDFANKNTFGGAIFTTFSFLWVKNAWEYYAISRGVMPDPTITLAVDIILLLIFVVLAYGFGFFSLTLFLFLIDIDLLYVCKIINHLTHSAIMVKPIGIFTALLGFISLWLAFAALINPVAGRQVFGDSGPVFFSARKKNFFDWSARNNIFSVLYEHWKEHAFQPMALEELAKEVRTRIGERSIVPDLFYLMDYGAIVLGYSDEKEMEIRDARLNAKGIDIYEQLILKKYEF